MDDLRTAVAWLSAQGVRFTPGGIRRGAAGFDVLAKRALAIAEMRVADWNWLAEDQRDVSVKVRSLAPPVAAVRESDLIRFAQPEYGVAPGQAAVAYDGTRLLGGGWIAQTASAATLDANID